MKKKNSRVNISAKIRFTVDKYDIGYFILFFSSIE